MNEAPALAREPFNESVYLAALQTLGLVPPVDRETIHRAYRERVKSVHPDRFRDGDEKERATRRVQDMNVAHAYALQHWHGFQLVRRWNEVGPPDAGAQWHEWLMLPVTSIYALTTIAAAMPVIVLGRLIGGERRARWRQNSAGTLLGRLWLLTVPHVATLALFAQVDELFVKAWFGVSFLIMFSADVATLVTGDTHTLRRPLGSALAALPWSERAS